jgi:haloacetate dehalogenase
VAADLRGYGDSSQPQGLPDHSNYSKHAMAQDQVDVMRHFGFTKFAVVGQDRGGRVAHRMALDHPDAITRAVFIDIVPTYYLYTHVTIEFVQSYFHWFNYLRPSPAPENELLAQQRNAPAGRSPSPAQAEYRRRNGTPEGVHAMCEDYRAGASIDLQHDAADLGKKIRCPLNVLWAEGGAMDKIYDVLAIWRERARNVVGRGMPGGHNMQEGAPSEVLAELQRFLRA